jgi:pilus assembly protein CpaE
VAHRSGGRTGADCYSRVVAASQGSDAQIRLLVVEDMPQVAQYIRSLLDAQSKVKLLDVITDGRQVIDQIREQQPDLIIVDALLQGKINGLQVAQDVREAGIDLPIIALTVPTKPISVGEGMGSTRVLSMPFSGFDFMHLVQQLHDDHRAQAPESFSRVYSIFGAKGGVGTTTLAYNIAAAIAAEGQYRVALMDGSLQFGDLRALLRLPESAPSILQLPINKVQRADVEQVVHRDASGVHVLLAPPRIEMAEMITARDLEKLISLMRRLYNIVIIDTASTVDDVLLAFLDASDELIQVLTYEWASLYQAKQLSSTLTAAGYPAEKIKYIVNRADSTGGLSRDAIAQQIGRNADFEVVSDGILVLEANNRGEPFMKLGPDAAISRDVARIAHHLSSALPTNRQAAAAKA